MSTPPARRPPAVPFGFVVVVAVLVLAIIGVLLVATSDDETAPERSGIEGLRVSDNLSQNHTGLDGGRVDYPDRATRPPLGGNHNPLWQDCRAYSAPVAPEHVVHSLEHGAVWITYRQGLAADQVGVLDALAGGGQEYVLVSPYPGQQSPVTLTAWGRQLDVDSATDPRVAEFVQTYADGPQNREPGAGCDSPLTETSEVPLTSTDGTVFTPGTSTRTYPAQGPVD